MNDITGYLASVGITSTISVAITLWLLRLVAEERIKLSIKSEYDQKLESFKNSLAVANAKEVESLKAQLQIAAITRQVQYSSLHQKAVEAMAEVYAKIARLRDAVADYVKILENSGEPSKEARREKVASALVEFNDCYIVKKLYLSKAAASKVDRLVDLLFTTAHEFKWKVELPSTRKDELPDIGAWSGAYETMKNEVPSILTTVEDDFRRALGHSDEV